VKPTTVSDLVDHVTSMIDEDNRASVSVQGDILPALNRAVLHAAETLARYYEYPLIRPLDIVTSDDTGYFDIPEDALAGRLQHVEAFSNGYYYELPEIPYHQLSRYEAPGRVATPSAFTVIGNRFKLTPTPRVGLQVRIWYAVRPDPLVLPAGRITVANENGSYVILDALNSEVSVTSQADKLESFVNVVDAQTGAVKSTRQVALVSDSRLNFRATPTRAEVWGKSVTGGAGGLSLDDYVCSLGGTCVLPVTVLQHLNFLVQYATAEIRRKLGDGPEMEANILTKFEDQMRGQWAGRAESIRVSKNSPYMGSRGRFWRTTSV